MGARRPTPSSTGGADRSAANFNLVHERKAVRRLVRSPAELWAQCSDPQSLARHLSGSGEIRITRLEPESTVVWEGASVSGTVTLEASGWGTRVQLTGAPPHGEASAELEAALDNLGQAHHRRYQRS